MAKKTSVFSRDRSDRIIAATKELHEAVFDCWDKDDDPALGMAFETLSEMKDKTLERGEGIEGWSGGTIKQADAIDSVLILLDTYDAEEKV